MIIGRKVLIFTTPTCLPCKQLKTQLGTMKGVEYLDMESDVSAQEMARKYCLRKAPSTLLMKDGVPVDSISGYSQTVIKKIKDFLND